MVKTMTPRYDRKAPEVDRALMDRLAHLRQLFARNAGAEEVLQFLCWPEFVTTAEGAGKVLRGLDEVLPAAKEIMQAMGTDCTWTVTDPIISSGDLASMFTQITCHYADVRPLSTYCVLYVWQRRGDDWKVIHEMVCQGALR